MNGLPAPEIEAYDRANGSLLGLIRGEQCGSRSAASRRQRAEAKLARIRAILTSLGNPQQGYPVVHVTGTSGKGSTAATIAAILTAAGYRVGLRTSPYLQVATEKLQIGASLIDALSFDVLVRRVLERAFLLYPPGQSGPRITYAEAWSVLGYWWFAERRVDIAVVEVGAGGRFDATNVIDPLISVITSVGLDHVVTLGPTIADIAWHKAGIIKPGSTAVVGDIPDSALAIIAREAKVVGAELVHASAVVDSLPTHVLVPSGFQRRNAELAAAVVETLGPKGFDVPPVAKLEGIRSARLPGRLERMPGGANPIVWIDGAHNADKTSALAQELLRISSGRPLPVIVLGVLDAKDPAAIVAGLRSVASSMVLTEPYVVGKRPFMAAGLGDILTASGYDGGIHVEPNADLAILCAADIAWAGDADVLVTGSMYLAGQVRRRWYADEDIVIQRTPWPAASYERRLRAR